MLWGCVSIMRASFADPRPPFGISAVVVLGLIMNNHSEVALYSLHKQASGLYTADDRLDNSLVVCKYTVFKWMRLCNSPKLNWSNDLCLVANRLQVSKPISHLSTTLPVLALSYLMHQLMICQMGKCTMLGYCIQNNHWHHAEISYWCFLNCPLC